MTTKILLQELMVFIKIFLCQKSHSLSLKKEEEKKGLIDVIVNLNMNHLS